VLPGSVDLTLLTSAPDALFILYVIWPALLLYQVTKQAGA
jgi:hypothetical protein